MSDRWPISFERVNRIVVKIGSAVLTNERGVLAVRRLNGIVREVAALMDRGIQVIIVSSGAVASGVGEMSGKRPRDLNEKQALAAIGQGMLMAHYRRAFRRHGRRVAQILVTREDMEDRRRYLNAYHTLEKLLQWGVVPIVNENDTTTVDELCFTDNDMLAVIVATKMNAQLLVLLSDVDGIYDKNPKEHRDAALIPVIGSVTREHEHLASGVPSRMGRGGMMSKIRSARLASVAGLPAVIANGRRSGTLTGVLRGQVRATLVLPQTPHGIRGRRKWIAIGGGGNERRAIEIDDGARAALVNGKKSLLPVGVRAVWGEFEAGEVVEIVDSAGEIVAKGLVNYSSHQLTEIKGLKSGEIQTRLGSDAPQEIVHRNNLVMIVNH
ncbi:MAG: glutamate 5-kinase [Candidatus Sumerlaeia bacterium]